MTKTTFCFRRTLADPFSRNYSMLGRVPKRPPKETIWRLVKDSLYDRCRCPCSRPTGSIKALNGFNLILCYSPCVTVSSWFEIQVAQIGCSISVPAGTKTYTVVFRTEHLRWFSRSFPRPFFVASSMTFEDPVRHAEVLVLHRQRYLHGTLYLCNTVQIIAILHLMYLL